MCLSICACFVEFLPYICLVTVPFYGSFCGIDIILRVSLFLYFYVAVSECIPKVLFSIVPYLNLGILTLIVVYVPMNLIPYPVIWLYDKLLWLSDPFLLVIEIVLAMNFVMHCSRRAAEQIEEDEEEAWKWKLLLTCFSALCYAVMVSLGVAIYKEGSNLQFWMLVIVASFSLILAAHNMMWMSHEGIISDVAFASLCSMVVVYSMKEEAALMNHPLMTPKSWFRYNRSLPLFQLTYKILYTTMENANLAIQFLLKFLSPLFLTLLAVRLYSILFLVHRIIRNFGLETEDSLEADDISWFPWRSPLFVKVSMIFMITQSTARFFYQSSGTSIYPSWWTELLISVWLKDIMLGRVLQIIAVNCFYIWRIYRADEWEWSDWFSE